MTSQEGIYVLTAPSQTIDVLEPIENADSVYIVAFSVEGVPLVAGLPVTDSFVVICEQLNAPCRSTNAAVGRGALLPIEAARSYREFFHPVIWGRTTSQKLSRMHVKVLQENGEPAVFSKLILRVRIYNNQVQAPTPLQGQSIVRGYLRNANRLRPFDDLTSI